MRFEELVLEDADDELRVRFHPELTVLSGLGKLERRALIDSLLSSLVGGPETTTMRFLDPVGRPVMIVGQDGQVTARHGDGAVLPDPLGQLSGDPARLRSLMVVGADDLGVMRRPARDDEPPELREARAMLEELSAELEAALGQQQQVQQLYGELEALDLELHAARDCVARREYAQVLAQLERVRAEAAAVQSGTAGVEADRHLVGNIDTARELAARWTAAAERVAELATELEGRPRFDLADRDRLAAIPSEPPADLPERVADLEQAAAAKEMLDQRLQELSVAQLPAPSDPLVAELGVVDQPGLWRVAERLTTAAETMARVQVSLGGLELHDMGASPALIHEIESAHADVEAAERAVEASRLPGIAVTGLSLAASVAGLVVTPLLVPLGLVVACVAAVAGIIRPRVQRAAALRAERRALARADATSYLGFHIRRVEASVDPELRDKVEAASSEHRAALAEWVELVGAETGVEAACALRTEIEGYNEALRNLGDTADEIEQLRRELEMVAIPSLRSATEALGALVGPFLLEEGADEQPSSLAASVAAQCERGAAARAQTLLDEAESDEQKASAQLDDLLLRLGFDAGPLDARVGALEWAVTRAMEREEARRRARPRAEIDAEVLELQNTAAKLRRPEWATVTAADAATPDIAELEARRTELMRLLAEARADVDTDRLADRHAAVERRVVALEARHGGNDATADPGALADIKQHLLAHLTAAAVAGPDNDPIPVVLDEVFLRVPADRKWDLLDLLHRLAERHQLIYLSDDAFVAAWARQRALDGVITLLELAPEPAS